MYADDDRALTPRMRDVLRAAAAGASAKETAGELHLSEACIRTVRRGALARLGQRNITAAVVEAYRRGEL